MMERDKRRLPHGPHLSTVQKYIDAVFKHCIRASLDHRIARLADRLQDGACGMGPGAPVFLVAFVVFS
jgi:hypothetical protein